MKYNIGINLAANEDWGSAQPWVNLTNMVRRWGSAAAPWDSKPPALGLNGYPAGDFGGVWAFTGNKPGTYNYSFDGVGQIAFGGGGKILQAGQNKGTVQLPASGNTWFSITKTDPAHPVNNLKIVHQDYAQNAWTLFTPQFLKSLKGFSVLRFMDWTRTNNSNLQHWNQRPLPGQQQTGPFGVAEEYQIELCNQTGCHAWLNIPSEADDDYIEQLASLWCDRLCTGLAIYLEYSNEVWNPGFQQMRLVQKAALSNPELTSKDQWACIYQQVAFRLKKIIETFRRHADAKGPAIRGVFCGQMANGQWLRWGLDYLETKYGKGTAANLFHALSGADYFSPADSWDVAGATVDGGFASLKTVLQVNLTRVQQLLSLAVQYGVRNIVAYEAGIGLYDRKLISGQWVSDWNHQAKSMMQYDHRMKDIYTQAIQQFFAAGGSLWNHYNHIQANNGRDGYWGARQSQDDSCPKWTALMQLLGQPV